jgi:acyl-CoA synthetase (NDP forming)
MTQSPANLHHFLHPRVAAVIGVTDTPGRPGYSLFKKIRAKVEREGGKVVPVNPKLKTVDGLTAYASINDIPEAVDLAVIMVGDAVAALQDCVAKKPAFAVIFTAGFAEAGEHGAQLQAQIATIARAAGIRVFGPNTNLNAFEIFKDLPGKKIALITQSGHQGRPIVQGEEFGVGFSYWIPTGNEVDLECCDFIDYFAEHEDTGVIAAYIEGFKDGERLKRAADHAARKRKPIVLIKVGRSAAGVRMAMAHTGHLAGSDAVHEALFKQYGITRVNDLDELLETSALFARLPPPRGGVPQGDGVCIYGISGGSGALMADLCGAAGIRLPTLAADTQTALRQFIPGYLTVANPVDNGATTIMAGHGPKILALLLDEPNTDLVICPITGALPPISDTLARELVDGWHSGKKPIVVVWGSPKLDDAAYRILVEGRVPLFRSFRNAVHGVKAYLDYHRFADAYNSPFAGQPVAAGFKPVLPTAAGPLSEHASKALLQQIGIATTREVVCRSSADAVSAALDIGFPVAMKINSAGIPHKSEAGLVRLNMQSEDEVTVAFADLVDRARVQHPQAQIDGVLVQEMVTDGIETLVGVSRDPVLGPAVVFGLGGIFVEVMHDVAMRTVPLTRRDAAAMVRELKGFAILDGARGRPKADVEAVVDTICAVAAWAQAARDRLQELDINPLMVLPAGRGVKAADALVVLR